MKNLLLVLLVCLGMIACGEDVEPLKTLQKGAPNSVTLSNGEIVYNLDGEWNCVYQQSMREEEPEDIIKISQDGNTFVGIYVNGHVYMNAGSEAIKGELEKNGFKSVYVNTTSDPHVQSSEGWKPATGKISENCDKIITTAKVEGDNVKLTLNRK